MARVLMIGYGPLPQPGLSYITSPALRTRQFLMPLLEAGHTVNLFALPLPGTEGPDGKVAAMTPDTYEGITFQRFTSHSGEFAIRTLNEQIRQLEPDAIVGVNTYPSYVGAMAASTVPVWGDLNGYWMAEIQGRCWIEQDDARLEDAWAIERSILRRIDKFSVVSRPQLHAVLGEMAGLGRLNQYTFQYQFGHYVPNAAYAWPDPEGERDGGLEPVLRGPVVPSDAFIILWSGGFNVWCDVPTLVESLNMLMERHPAVHFVSTGGRVEGPVAKTYQIFEELVEASAHKDRFHLMGWVDSGKLSRIYREANLGLNADGRNYETMFGSRHRLCTMAAAGLAIATTRGTELSEWLEDGRAAVTAPVGDPEALADAIEPWIEQREGLRAFARNAKRIMATDFSPEKTVRSLLEWLKSPRLAPDNRAKIDLAEEPLTDLSAFSLNALDEEAMLFARHRPREIREAIGEWEASRNPGPQRRFTFGMRRSR